MEQTTFIFNPSFISPVNTVAVSWLVNTLSPVNNKGIHQGWTQNFNLSPSYSFHKSLYHKSFNFFFSNYSSNSIHNFGTQSMKNNNTFFWAYLYFVNTQHENLHSAGWPILFWGLHRNPVLVTANTRKTLERFWKNAGEWTGRVEISM